MNSNYRIIIRILTLLFEKTFLSARALEVTYLVINFVRNYRHTEQEFIMIHD